MERRLTKKIEKYQVEFKDNIKKWLKERDLLVVKENWTDGNEDDTSDFLKFMYDYPSLMLTKDDFQKRKRVKNVVPHFERCTAKRANGEQCTRRKKCGECYCETHVKGTPHGVIDLNTNSNNTFKKVEVWIQEIQGINYYIDLNNNVYCPQDIINNKESPSIIAKWQLDKDNNYMIPEFKT